MTLGLSDGLEGLAYDCGFGGGATADGLVSVAVLGGVRARGGFTTGDAALGGEAARVGEAVSDVRDGDCARAAPLGDPARGTVGGDLDRARLDG